MIVCRWLGNDLGRILCQSIPGLGRLLNFPIRAGFAGDFASEVLEDRIEELALEPEALEQAMTILTRAMVHDAGDTSTYPQGRTSLRSLLFKIDHCIVTGHSMMVLDRTGRCVLTRADGPVPWDEVKFAFLKRRAPPEGCVYVLTSHGAFHDFFARDVIPLLHFLRARGADIGPLHIVTRPDAPPFVSETLQAICAAWGFVEILELAANERLEDARVLWLSREPEARDWTPVTRPEADELDALLGAWRHLPAPGEPDQLLFVSRGSARLRRLNHEGEIVAALMAYGFDFFVPKANDHKSQIAAFRSARVIVAVHGEALTNLLFCRPGTLVIELFPLNYIKSDYCWLALRLGLRYRPVLGFLGDDWQAFSVKMRDVVAAVEAELGPLPVEDKEEEEDGDEDEDEA